MRFALLTLALWSTFASAADLSLVFPEVSRLGTAVSVEFKEEAGVLHAIFDVRVKPLNVKQKFGPKDFPYKFDVVELFVTTQGEAVYPYFEFQVTPLNQTFVSRIDRPGKFIDNVQINWQTRITTTPAGWTAEMLIPLAEIGWTGDNTKLIGNAFSILGKKRPRSHFSLHLTPQTKPDFHKPEFFRPLLTDQSAAER